MPTSSPVNKSLVLCGCRVKLFEDQAYSELDELNYYALNSNDFGFGRVDVEISCENNLANPYTKFYISCVAIRADNKILCKINRNGTPNILALPNYTKITKDGKMAFGISYYFQSDNERDLLLKCNSFCFEGFIALKKKTDVFGFMCRVEQANNGWIMDEGNTYRIYKKANIDYLCH